MHYKQLTIYDYDIIALSLESYSPRKICWVNQLIILSFGFDLKVIIR
jgi:hypothetical protein